MHTIGNGLSADNNMQPQHMLQIPNTIPNQAIMQMPQNYYNQMQQYPALGYPTNATNLYTPASLPQPQIHPSAPVSCTPHQSNETPRKYIPNQGNTQHSPDIHTQLHRRNLHDSYSSLSSFEGFAPEMDDEMSENGNTSKHPWQQIKKRKRTSKHQPPETSTLKVQNRYKPLETHDTNETPENSKNTTVERPKTQKPPPIFIYGVKNYKAMIDTLTKVAAKEMYYTKALADETVKINSHTPDTYRKIVTFLKNENIIHHTYQMKEDRAYRVVIRNLHYSVPTDEIKKELEEAGHEVRNIMNIQHRLTKKPLCLFYIDLEPRENNKAIYELQFIYNTRITIEAPRRNRGIVQCTRCQQYGHSKTYCNKPYNCVKCGDQHNTKICTKPKNTPAKCALCNGDHPANYRGCNVYKELTAQRNGSRRPLNKKGLPENNIPPTQQETPVHNPLQGNMSYARIVTHNRNNAATEQQTDLGLVLSTFLNDFKTMFSQLLNQNSTILNLLTTVMNKLNG